MKKPDRTQAMLQLIKTVREKFPFNESEANMCTGQCNSCSMKLLDYLDIQLEDWEYRLKKGEIPTFGDIQQIAKTSKKIYHALDKHNLVD